MPEGLTAVGTGLEAQTQRVDGVLALHRWRLDQPMPAYVYGFAVGRLHSASARAAGVDLDFHSSELDSAQLQRVFADTGDMLRFFEARSGLRFDHKRYSQVLVSDTIGQELAGMSLLSEEYGRDVLADRSEEGLIAHELAHQWWGNRITCRDWGHFWLNEAFANFMTAAYLQRRFGDKLYLEKIEAWRLRLEKLRAEGKDHALVYEQWHPTRDDRAVVYQKGAYVLHLLRQELGEKAFWRGIRAYSRAHDGKPVATIDFQRAMERASGRDLETFFRRWVLAS
ncbi:MAG: M1 family aminopeptidase [Arenimonas sp.]